MTWCLTDIFSTWRGRAAGKKLFFWTTGGDPLALCDYQLAFCIDSNDFAFFVLTIIEKCDFEPCEGVVGTLRFKGDPTMARRSPLEVFQKSGWYVSKMCYNQIACFWYIELVILKVGEGVWGCRFWTRLLYDIRLLEILKLVDTKNTKNFSQISQTYWLRCCQILLVLLHNSHSFGGSCIERKLSELFSSFNVVWLSVWPSSSTYESWRVLKSLVVPQTSLRVLSHINICQHAFSLRSRWLV